MRANGLADISTPLAYHDEERSKHTEKTKKWKVEKSEKLKKVLKVILGIMP